MKKHTFIEKTKERSAKAQVQTMMHPPAQLKYWAAAFLCTWPFKVDPVTSRKCVQLFLYLFLVVNICMVCNQQLHNLSVSVVCSKSEGCPTILQCASPVGHSVMRTPSLVSPNTETTTNNAVPTKLKLQICSCTWTRQASAGLSGLKSVQTKIMEGTRYFEGGAREGKREKKISSRESFCNERLSLVMFHLCCPWCPNYREIFHTNTCLQIDHEL